ncbi:AAA family ATPase [Vibrio sp. Y42_MX_L11]|uniref:AAA family ATPase n=1 Tax=Vibrio TaxID=662 RepID=UPI0020A5B5CD|nr:AAA family ATPase [Vibrio sp. Y42_MX_L11]
MLLKKLVVSGYKSISTSHPQTIEFEPDLTIFIGHNGTGKSAALEALNKLFSIDHSLRVSVQRGKKLSVWNGLPPYHSAVSSEMINSPFHTEITTWL